MDVDAFAGSCGKPVNEIQAFVKGERRVTLPLAKTLEKATGVPAGMWQRLQAMYDRYLLRIARERERALAVAD